MGKVLVSKAPVDKVKTGQATGGLSVLIQKKKKKPIMFYFLTTLNP